MICQTEVSRRTVVAEAMQILEQTERGELTDDEM